MGYIYILFDSQKESLSKNKERGKKKNSVMKNQSSTYTKKAETISSKIFKLLDIQAIYIYTGSPH